MGDRSMEDKLEEVLKQYPCEVRTRRRTRGAFLLETDQGLRLLKELPEQLGHAPVVCRK